MTRKHCVITGLSHVKHKEPGCKESDPQKEKEGSSIFIQRQHQGGQIASGCFIGCQDPGVHNRTLNCLSDTLGPHFATVISLAQKA